MLDRITRYLRTRRLVPVQDGALAARFGSAPPRPERPLYVVGDIHGEAALLEQLLAVIDQDADAIGLGDAVLVFLGDYVDRGERSREVLERLHALSSALPAHVLCLMGNHERMMLDFLERPAEAGQRWLRNGGLQTLASFGVGGVHIASEGDDLERAATGLRDSLAPDLEAWLRDLPLICQSGNICLCHAGADPKLPLASQPEQVLLWGPPRGADGVARRDGVWVVHGHHVVPEPVAAGGRIALDTGACFSGRLHAAHLNDGAVRFLSAERGRRVAAAR